MTFPETIRAAQNRLDDILTAYRARDWPQVYALFRALGTDVFRAKDAAVREELGR